MRIGIHPVSFPTDAPEGIAPLVKRIAVATEAAGCSHLLLMDHYLQLPFVDDPKDAVLEGYTTSGFLAAVTERVQLGLLVTGVTYRHPALLVKIVTTLDVLSGGRAVLALGAGWYQREHDAYGVPFPGLAERFERLEDTLRIAHQMWSDDDGPFRGIHHTLAETVCAPQPIRRPHPPILIGGGGERKTLRLVARYADASNLVASGYEEVSRKLGVLDRHCEEVGREPSSVERTLMVIDDVFADLPRTREELAAYEGLGITTVFLVPPPGRDPIPFVERVGEELVSLDVDPSDVDL
jgi:F420-dependent oxidoreductase-like protein